MTPLSYLHYHLPRIVCSQPLLPTIATIVTIDSFIISQQYDPLIAKQLDPILAIESFDNRILMHLSHRNNQISSS